MLGPMNRTESNQGPLCYSRPKSLYDANSLSTLSPAALFYTEFLQREGRLPQPDNPTSGLFTEIASFCGEAELDDLAECQNASEEYRLPDQTFLSEPIGVCIYAQFPQVGPCE